MNKYVVAYSMTVNPEIEQQVVEATSSRDAAIRYLAQFQDIVLSEEELLQTEDLDLLAEHLWDYYDVLISVIEI